MRAVIGNPSGDAQGGEDLRLDQRVEQLFDVMNGMLRHHPAAAAAALQVPPCPLPLHPARWWDAVAVAFHVLQPKPLLFEAYTLCRFST